MDPSRKHRGFFFFRDNFHVDKNILEKLQSHGHKDLHMRQSRKNIFYFDDFRKVLEACCLLQFGNLHETNVYEIVLVENVKNIIIKISIDQNK